MEISNDIYKIDIYNNAIMQSSECDTKSTSMEVWLHNNQPFHLDGVTISRL